MIEKLKQLKLLSCNVLQQISYILMLKFNDSKTSHKLVTFSTKQPDRDVMKIITLNVQVI